MHLKPLSVVFLLLSSSLMQSQTVTSFEGIDASQLTTRRLDVDPNGAVGTLHFMEWVNTYYQAYGKSTFAPVWATPQNGTQPWHQHNMPNCYNVAGDGIITFDRVADRWVIAVRSSSNGNYYYCLAVSNTGNLTSNTFAWSTYQFLLNPILGTNAFGHVYFPDWPRLGTWADAYYVTFNLLDPDHKFKEIGVVACALDRLNIIKGLNPRAPQCFSDPNPIPSTGSVYLSHSLIPADLEGTTAPPAGRDEFMVSIQNPLVDGFTTTSSSLNLWDFHVDWGTPSNSRFSRSSLSVAPYTPGCYNPTNVLNALCVPEPAINPATGAHYRIDSVGDRIMPRLAYRNFVTYESFLFSFTVQVAAASKQTGIRWFELRGSGIPHVARTGRIDPDNSLFRFLPGIAQDRVGNVAVGYSVSSATTHPGIKAAWWPLGSTTPTEILIQNGSGDEENSWHWGDYTSMTVDPIDNCTFWYVNQYLASNQTETSINWKTRIGNFKISTCH